MKHLASWFFGVHVIALVFGLFGILIAIPHPELWAHAPGAAEFFSWSMERGGAMAMVSGGFAMFAWGVVALGWRRTAIFAVAACVLSATAELTGTATGWPFGGYEYLTFLGWKIAGRVPYGVPLSWFYMGFASYVLASAVVPEGTRGALWRRLLLGAWLLTAWDLVLDPAMVAMTQIKFWVWHESGPYYGMPLRNLAGWFGTGLAFIGVARALWRRDLRASEMSLTIPFWTYALNVMWAMALSLSAGLWPTALAAIVLSLGPAVIALRPRREVARAA